MNKKFLLFAGLFTVFIIKSMAQWEIKHLGDFNYHSIVKFKNDSVGLVMGNDSFVLKTADAGENWYLQELDFQLNIVDFQFVEDMVVYAVGYIVSGQELSGKLIMSSDNGETWDSIAILPGKQLFSLNFFDIESGLIAGNDGIFLTTDSGNTWEPVVTINQLGYIFGEIRQISFPSLQTGYAIGSGFVESVSVLEEFLLKTTDAGLTWDVKKVLDKTPTTVCFLDEETGFLGSNDGLFSYISKTTDGGQTWDTKYDFESIPVTGFHFINDMTGFAVGGYELAMPGPTGFSISKTTDGGENWFGIDTLGLPLKSIYFLNDSTGFVAGWYQLVMKSHGNAITELPDDYPWHLVDTGMSVNEEQPNDSFKLYPNPTRSKLNIIAKDTNQEIQAIEIISITGQVEKVLQNLSGKTRIVIDLSGYVPGLYFVRVLTSHQSNLLKVIKQ